MAANLRGIVINEILPDPTGGTMEVDVEGNGSISSQHDEFVELYNSGNVAVDISGWELRDTESGNNLRHTVPAGTILQPGEYYLATDGFGGSGVINNGAEGIILTDTSTGQSSSGRSIAVVHSTTDANGDGIPEILEDDGDPGDPDDAVAEFNLTAADIDIFPADSAGMSIQRIDDGGDTFINSQATPGARNNQVVQPSDDDGGTTSLNTPINNIDVLANDVDRDGDPLQVVSFDATSANGGTVTQNANGTFNYTPAVGFEGTDTFTYRVTDDQAFNQLLPGNQNTPDNTTVDGVYTAFDATTRAVPGQNNEALNTDNNSETSKEATVSITVECFLTGTQILTDVGERAVETLKIGDRIKTAEGKLVAIKWVAYQTIDPQQPLHPFRSLPIQIKAGALGENLPVRDLFVSPDHAILVEGLLVNAGALENGSSIIATQPQERFTYYHIELEQHSLLIAEGAYAESYLPQNQQRDTFDNGDEYEALYPNHNILSLLPMSFARVSSKRQLPRCVAKHLAEVAETLPKTLPNTSPEDETFVLI